MATTNYNLPTISGASPVAIVDDYNALANATDAALAGAISGEKTRAMAAETELANGVSNALTTANSANVSATDAKSAAEKAQTTASTALNNAATAQTTADGAKSTAETAESNITELNATVDSLKEHTTFISMAQHNENPWPAGLWHGKHSRDKQRIEINGIIRIRPGGGGAYVDGTALNAIKVTVPGTSIIGIPLFDLDYSPEAAETIEAGLYWATTAAADAFTFNGAFASEIVIGTDGVAYLALSQYAMNSNSYVYGSVNTGTWTI